MLSNIEKKKIHIMQFTRTPREGGGGGGGRNNMIASGPEHI